MVTKLQKLRKEKNMSQSQLVKAAGVGLRPMQAYEQGYRNIDGAKIETLLDISVGLNCRISDIIENEELAKKLKDNGY